MHGYWVGRNRAGTVAVGVRCESGWSRRQLKCLPIILSNAREFPVGDHECPGRAFSPSVIPCSSGGSPPYYLPFLILSMA